MYRQEGWYGFFKGNGVNVARIAPFSAFEFYFYEVYKAQLFTEASITPSKKLLCGAFTGMTATALTYPLDLIRLKLSIRVDPGVDRPGMIGTGKYIYQKRGILGLYRGISSSLFVSLLFSHSVFSEHHSLRWCQDGSIRYNQDILLCRSNPSTETVDVHAYGWYRWNSGNDNCLSNRHNKEKDATLGNTRSRKVQ